MVTMESEKILTLKAVILYIIKNSKTDKRDVYSIVKTAYFAQQNHLAEYGTQIFDDKITALPFGPVPSAVYDILKFSRGDKKPSGYQRDQLLSEVAKSIGFSKETFSAKELPDMDYLSASDIKSLDAAIAKVSKMSFNDIKSKTHGEEWTRASKTRTKLLDTVAIAREGGASEDMISYLQANIELQSVLG